MIKRCTLARTLLVSAYGLGGPPGGKFIGKMKVVTLRLPAGAALQFR